MCPNVRWENMRLPTDNSSADWRRVSVRFSLYPHTHVQFIAIKKKKWTYRRVMMPLVIPGVKKGNHNRFLMASALCPPPNQNKGSDSSVGDKMSTVLTSDQISDILHSGQELNLSITPFKRSVPKCRHLHFVFWVHAAYLHTENGPKTECATANTSHHQLTPYLWRGRSGVMELARKLMLVSAN